MAAGVLSPPSAKNNPQVAPSYSMLARGTSVDGYWTTDFPTGAGGLERMQLLHR